MVKPQRWSRRPPRWFSNQEGYFLATVLILAGAVIMMAAGLATVSTATMRVAQRNLDRARALYAAESGMNVVIHSIASDEENAASLELRLVDRPLPPSATYNVWLGEKQCLSRGVVAEGSSNGVSRRFRARIRLTSLPFPPPPYGPEVSTAGCEDDYADVGLTLTPIDEILPPKGWERECSTKGTITGEGPIYIRCDKDMELKDLTIEATGEVNIFVQGDLWVGSGGWLTVAPGARVKFYVYGNVVLGKCKGDIALFCELDKLFGSRLTVRTEDDVIFHVQKGLISNPGAVVKVLPHQLGHSPGAVVFLISSAPEYSSEPVEIGPTEAILDAQIRTLLCEDQAFANLFARLWLCEGSATELAVYAPSRTVTYNSMSIRWNFLDKTVRMQPHILGAIVRRQGKEGCVTSQNEDSLSDVLRGGKIEHTCHQGHTVDYNDRLRQFQLWRPSRLVLGSWREERLTP